MKQRQMPLLMFVFVAVLALPLLSGAVKRGVGTTQASVKPQCGQWSIVHTPPHKTLAALGAVTMISPSNAWAVGVLGNYGSSNDATLTEHWNGSTWSVVKSPRPGNSSYLYGVAAVATNDIWAVGSYGTGGSGSSTLTLHWDGTHWRKVSSPSPSSFSSLNAVTAISTNDVWAVGYQNLGPAIALVEHWNGSSWSVSNGATRQGRLNATSADAANDVWAVGQIGIYHTDATVIEHWNGSSWSVGPRIYSAELYGVTALTPTDVWAVGTYYNNGWAVLIEHWNGKKWKVVFSPNSNYGQLNAITAVPGTNLLWAVGYQGGNPTQTLAEQWDGTQWSIVPTPTKGFASSELLGVAATDASHVWSVGTYYEPAYLNHPLAEFYC